MLQIRLRLLTRGYSECRRYLAVAQPKELGEDEPDPMGFLLPVAQFRALIPSLPFSSRSRKSAASMSTFL